MKQLRHAAASAFFALICVATTESLQAGSPPAAAAPPEVEGEITGLAASPDGKWFFVAGQVSASTFDLLGRVDEAHRLFQKPHHAIAYHQGLLSGQSVRWVPARGKSAWALLSRRDTGELTAIVDPEIDAHFEDRFRGVKLLDFLPRPSQVGVDGKGLALNEPAVLGWAPNRRLIDIRKESGRNIGPQPE